MVDDDPINVSILQDLLHSAGYETLVGGKCGGLIARKRSVLREGAAFPVSEKLVGGGYAMHTFPRAWSPESSGL